MFIIQDREAGNKIEEFTNYYDAVKAIDNYERKDVEDGTYEEDFYEIVEA